MGMDALVQRHISTLSCASQLGHQTCLQTWSRVHHVAQAAVLHHAGPTCQLNVGSEPRPYVHKQQSYMQTHIPWLYLPIDCGSLSVCRRIMLSGPC